MIWEHDTKVHEYYRRPLTPEPTEPDEDAAAIESGDGDDADVSAEPGTSS